MTELVHAPLIELRDVSVVFGKHDVHRDLSFKVARGEGLTILGGSGTGKTLILRMIGGLLKPTSGRVHVLGTDITELNDEELTPIRAKIGMLFQSGALFDSLTVFENIVYAMREAKCYSEAQMAARVTQLLALIDLPGIEEKSPGQLSGGQRKRVALARALAREPEIVLFDEPTTGLDPTSTRLIDDLIIKLRTDLGITTIAVTHDIASAQRISTRWLLIDHGRVVADGPVSEVSKNNADVLRFTSGNWKD